MKIIFVFGSNLSGIHGAGAARAAVNQHGAIMRQAIGLQGNSYAIPTKDYNVRDTLPLDQIAHHVTNFIKFAEAHPEMMFEVTRIGCGLAGYNPSDIAPLFKGVPDNCIMPEDFKPWLI